MKAIIIKFGMLAVALMVLLELSRYSLITRNLRFELTISATAVALIVLGIYLGRNFLYKKSKRHSAIDPEKTEQLGISKRELQVLREMAMGKSNVEIADALFIAESTVKTHVSNLLVKLDSKRRTEAINKAQEAGLLYYFSRNTVNPTKV